ncbi:MULTISPECIES: Nif3-like dinuclear metal center hexameric protein [unclassified Fibrobacter]|uniref:Nif3-like dinuclear metal center hexameric protein n=1 Tax=unclassified Fibrobacter TaxID=2634177 RepID=UPI000D6B9CE2|nr:MULTISPECIES: Nif3-like dinuclear metal center hexameric protein [unclassified Fibrobacter]PWJ71858.1 dinuclear metal center YbgI/SA1388 family protein [Fibrobacter sp. UWR4]PZW73773.1 dinuclear metal center YbgI/SA1388 family protein [Fibrobacter sp. UWR1]
MELKEFSSWLNDLLTPQAFRDYCTDGLCVEANDKVTKVVTGVSFRDRLIDAAIEEKADCIIVHHPNGFWKGEDRVLVGKFGERMRRLMQNGISLYGFHLPLDGHPEIGNNALIAKRMGLQVTEGFMQEGVNYVGWIGEFPEPMTQEAFVAQAEKAFAAGVQTKLFYGSKTIRKVAICSGSGASGINEALSLGCDAFITGEIKESVPIICEESNFNLIACGHHRTEIFGVQALAEKIQSELKIPAKFVDIDNPI